MRSLNRGPPPLANVMIAGVVGSNIWGENFLGIGSAKEPETLSFLVPFINIHQSNVVAVASKLALTAVMAYNEGHHRPDSQEPR